MNLRGIDLNLLVIFDALITERSVSRAAQKVGITQSAMSHALRRLRRTFKDDVIKRTSRGMVPTPRAVQLSKRLKVVLQQIERAVEEQLHFDPRTSERAFRIRISEYLIGCLMPRLCARLRVEGPRLTFAFDHLPARIHQEPEDLGDLQLRVCSDPPLASEQRYKRLLLDRFVVVMRRAHPAAAGKMTLDVLLSLPHVRVASAITGSALLDMALETHGFSRPTPITVPTPLAVLPIVLESDVCAILPEQWVALYVDPALLAIRPLPAAPVRFTVDEVWHASDEADDGHRWLRRLVEDEFAEMRADASLQWDEGRRRARRLARSRAG